MLEILGDLFVNLVIIIATLTMGNLVLRDQLSKVTKNHPFLSGIMYTILGCLLMLFKVHVSPGVFVDFRCLPILVMGLYFPIHAAVFTGVFISLFRMIVFDLNAGSISSLVAAILMAVACGLIGKTRLRIQIKWLLAYFAVIVIVTADILFQERVAVLYWRILPAIYIGLLIVSAVTYFIVSYNRQSNDRYYSIEKASSIDFLTGLHNVRHFDKTLNTYLAQAKTNRTNLSLLFIDVDYFKKINDTYGHLNGDRVLQGLSSLLMALARDEDIVTRKGGEEFTILLAGCTLSAAVAVAERIREEIEKYEFLSSNKEVIKITVSIGVSSFPETTKDHEKLTEQADIALYKAKRAGRNRVCTAEPESCVSA